MVTTLCGYELSSYLILPYPRSHGLKDLVCKYLSEGSGLSRACFLPLYQHVALTVELISAAPTQTFLLELTSKAMVLFWGGGSWGFRDRVSVSLWSLSC